MEEKSKPIRIVQIIVKAITALLIAFTVFMMVFTIISVTTFDRNDRNVLGLRFYIVRTDSMSPSEKNAHLDVHFSAGDLIIVKKVKDPTALKSGDIITFISMNQDDSWGQTITHMIREPYYDESGKFVGYVTFGTNKDSNDASPVGFGEIIGQYTGKIPRAGHFFAFVKSTPGYISCILIPFLILILVNGVDVIRLFRRYKKEQTDAINAEKEEIAAERARNEDMLRELLALKEQLATGSLPNTQTAEAVKPIEVTPEPATKSTPEQSTEPAKAEAKDETAEPVKAEATPEEEEVARKKAEAARKRKETIARKKAEAEAEAARLAAEEEAERLAAEETARKKAEAARKRKETIARKKAEAEAARLAAENDASETTEATEE